MRDRDTMLGVAIYNWRKERRITQVKLAALLGMSRQRLSEWEVAGVPFGESELARLAMRQIDRNLLPSPTEF